MTFSVVGLGEVLWDMLPAGPKLGGAPTNFTYQARALGARALMVTRVGDDVLGRQVIERFRMSNLPSETIQMDPIRPTGTVAVTLNDKGGASYAFADNVAWDHLAATCAALTAVSGADAVCFGTLGQRNPVARASIQQLVAAVPAEALRIFDVNLRLDFYSRDVIEQSLHLSNVLKLNDEELSVLTEMFSLRGNLRERIEWFVRTFGLKMVVLTSGSLGSLIYREGRWSEAPPLKVQVEDTVGAGDAFTAALTVGLLNGMDLDEVHDIAAKLARFVCCQPGATPPMPETFRSKFAQ